MNDNNHISEEDFLAFQTNNLGPEETVHFLEHLCSCNYCSDQLAAFMSEDIIPAPKDLKENILRATKRPEVQLALKVSETSKRMQLFIYSLKVGTATVGALLLLLFTMNLNDSSFAVQIPTEIHINEDNNSSITNFLRDGMDNISQSMLDFSNNIIKTEDKNNDQKEK